MIEFKTGNILTEEVDALVNTVNCVGVMGRGIALQFKRSFPDNFKAYKKACDRGNVQPGRMFVFETGQTFPRYIINFPTKRHWRGKSRIQDVDSGLEDLVNVVRKHEIRSIAIPPLGSGLGGLNWSEVRPRIEKALSLLDDVQVVIFEPLEAPLEVSTSTEVPNITPGRAALVGLIDQYLSGLLDPFVTLLEVHKLMYFMQVAGEPLSLRYTKGPYGPYADNLRHVLRVVDGHLISGYADGGDQPDKPLALVPGVRDEVQIVLEQNVMTMERFKRVAGLVAGFETSFGLELLATVHWIAEGHEGNVATIEEVIRKTYDWNNSKRKFSKRQIELAYDVLKSGEWITSDTSFSPSAIDRIT